MVYEKKMMGNIERSDEIGIVLKVTDWLMILVLLCIPAVNIALLIIWAFGKGDGNRRNYARAVLILLGIFAAVWLFFILFIMGMTVTGI